MAGIGTGKENVGSSGKVGKVIPGISNPGSSGRVGSAGSSGRAGRAGIGIGKEGIGIRNSNEKSSALSKDPITFTTVTLI
jgi:hypothetical protein